MRSKPTFCTLLLFAATILASLAVVGPCLAYTQSDPEVRGMWVQPGYFMDPSSTTSMVNNLANGHYNVICANAAWYGFLFCPPTAPDVSPMYLGLNGYDALDDLCTKAHAKGLQVHVWMFTNHIAANDYSQADYPTHVQNLHPEYLAKNSSGATSIYWIDPGVPGVETWNYNVAMDLIQNHDIDGISFDYIRYPDWTYGYNNIAIARFNDEFGHTGNPATDDSAFVAWRERQISDFCKKVTANAAAVKPNCCISAAVYQTGSTVLCPWNSMMQKGYLDMVEPMIYETGPANYWYVCLNRDVGQAYGRLMVIGQGAGQNSPSQTIGQINDVRDYGFQGVFSFSYYQTNNSGVSTADFCNTMATSPDAYPTVVSFPAMPWKTTQGILKGTVTDANTAAVIYNATVTMNGLTDQSDGTGFYALMKLTPGTYTATCTASGYVTASTTVTISAGAVTTVNFALINDGTPPVLSSIQASHIWSTLATISWTTDEKASGQIEYGLTAAYGTQTFLNTAKLANHSFSLTGLSPCRTYHYRVKSADGTGNLAASADQTFTTPNACAVEDIIIDNNNANNSGGSSASSSGSWTVAGTLSGKYAGDYAYIAHVPPPDTAWFKWTPNIIVPGTYSVYVWYTNDTAGSHSTGAPYTVYYDGGSQAFSVNQHINCARWNLLGSFDFLAGTSGYVMVGNGTNASGTYVMADAAKFSWVCETVPPTISAVSIAPPLVSGGAPVNVTVSATDNVEVKTVTADGTPLEPAGGDSYTGSIATDPARGLHPVVVTATDTADNTTTDASHTYRTAQILGLTSASLLAGACTNAGAGQFMYKLFGSVAVLDADHFGLCDGSREVVIIHCPNHGLITGRFVTAYGIWSFPHLESSPGQIQVIF